MEIRLKGVKLRELVDVEEALENALFDHLEAIKTSNECNPEEERNRMGNILKFMARLGIDLDNYQEYVKEAGLMKWWDNWKREEDR